MTVRTIRTYDECVEEAKTQIKGIFRDGIDTSRGYVFGIDVFAEVKSFADLHDYCDANTLGYICDEDCDFRDSDGVLIQRDSDSAESNEAWLSFGNKVFDAVDAWIKDYRANDHFVVTVLNLFKVADFLADDEARAAERDSLLSAVSLLRTHAVDTDHVLFSD